MIVFYLKINNNHINTIDYLLLYYLFFSSIKYFTFFYKVYDKQKSYIYIN